MIARASRGSESSLRAVFRLAAVAAVVALCYGTASTARADQQDDDRIKLRIQVRLSGQVGMDFRDAGLSVTDGIVTIRGNVGSIGNRDKVIRLVSGIVGVDGIVSQITVRPSRRSDAGIQEEIIDRLDLRPRFRDNVVNVTVTSGVVRLTGDVERSLDRYDAGEIAASVEGVVEITNEIAVRTEGTIPLPIVLERVRSVLTNTLTFGVIRDLDVQIDQAGVVLLEGTAQRQATAETAERLTLGVPGVSGVINRIEVLGS